MGQLSYTSFCLCLFRPDNMENNVYEMWIHATRLRDPGRVQPVTKAQDPPLSKVTLRTRKRLCRGISFFYYLQVSKRCRDFCFDWPHAGPPTHTRPISIMTSRISPVQIPYEAAIFLVRLLKIPFATAGSRGLFDPNR